MLEVKFFNRFNMTEFMFATLNYYVLIFTSTSTYLERAPGVTGRYTLDDRHALHLARKGEGNLNMIKSSDVSIAPPKSQGTSLSSR